MTALASDDWRALVREIARGTHGARALDPAQALSLWSALLDSRLPEAVVGAILIAYRFKGESVAELQALLQACAERAQPLAPPAAPLAILPCYNGGRRLPNLAWLTALALREAGFAVLLHGVRHDAGRLATGELARVGGAQVAQDLAQADRALRDDRLVFLPIDVWCPALAGLLARRDELGVRNSGHTACKLMNPFAPGSAAHADSVTLVPVTHAEYVPRATGLLAAAGARALVFRGVDGEAAIHPHAPRTVWRVGPAAIDEVQLVPPVTPDPALTLDNRASAAEIAHWSAHAAEGRLPMPAMSERLVALACALASRPPRRLMPAQPVGAGVSS